MSEIPQYPPLPQQPPYNFQRPPKSASTALLLELLPGLFGVYGIGWIYAGNVGLGVGILIGGLVWDGIAIAIDVATGGFGCFCSLPVNIAAVTLSTIMINKHTKQHPEIFG